MCSPVAVLTPDFPAGRGISGKKLQSGPSKFQKRYIYKILMVYIGRI
jgi:hypothetical protein